MKQSCSLIMMGKNTNVLGQTNEEKAYRRWKPYGVEQKNNFDCQFESLERLNKCCVTWGANEFHWIESLSGAGDRTSPFRCATSRSPLIEIREIWAVPRACDSVGHARCGVTGIVSRALCPISRVTRYSLASRLASFEFFLKVSKYRYILHRTNRDWRTDTVLFKKSF